MSVQKKSLIGDRTAVKKAIVASKPETSSVGEPKALKAEALKNTRLKTTHAYKKVNFKTVSSFKKY
jgi:hypothetical protein